MLLIKSRKYLHFHQKADGLNYFVRKIFSNSIDVFVQDAPSPIPPPNPESIFRIPEAPPRDKTTPAKPPTTNPVPVEIIISSSPFFIV
mmetsp:Transcript_39038/g.44523  ORF Transcript_39038/g.44523 Transcript_39038/m.44523 type:complete len:88 (-) Transcript_39038:259-522(-)